MMAARRDALPTAGVAALRPSATRPAVLFLWAAVPMLLLYAGTRARTVTGEDSGELITAAYQLGVAHPPGYPLWILLTKTFQAVFSGLNPADAAALGSSITTAAAIGLLAVVAFRLTRSAPASLFGAWAVGVGHEIWNHATIAEIYPLNLLVLAASLLLLDRWREVPTRRRLFALALVYGCGLANHPTFHLFLPLFLVTTIFRQPRLILDWRSMGLALLGLALPHVAYLQTYIAAARGAYVSWGVEPTLRSIVGHYLREIYALSPEKTAWTASKALSQLGAFGTFLVKNLTIAGVVAGFGGLALLVRKNRIFGGLMLGLSVLGTVGLLPFIKFDLEREELFASRVFLMPAYLVLGIGIAVLVDAVSVLVRSRQPRFRPAWALAVPIVAATLGYAGHDRTRYFWSEDYGRAILGELPKDAVLLPGGDTSTFPLLYLQGCLGERRDVVILDRSGTIERAEALSLLPDAQRAALKGAPRDALLHAVMALSGRPVITLRPERAPPELEVTYEPFGLGFLVTPARDKAAKQKVAAAREAYFKKLRLRNEDTPTVADYTADVIRSHLAQARALDFFRSGNPPAALDQAVLAVAFSRGIKETLNNVGSLVAENGLPDRSERFFREALAVRADYQLARQNLVVVLRNQRKVEEAFREATFGARVDPADPFFFREATDLAVALKDGTTLVDLCEARINATPDDPAPHRILGEWAMEVQHTPDVARAHFEAALAVDASDERSREKLAELRSEGRQPSEVAKAEDGPEPADFLAALLPPRIVDVRRDDERTGRLFRMSRESDAAAPVIGAAELRGILGQMRIPQSFDPMIGVPVAERRNNTRAMQTDPTEKVGETLERER